MAVVISPKPTALMPSRSRAYSTSTDQAAPKVTLKVKIVMASVRTAGWFHSQRQPSRMSSRTRADRAARERGGSRTGQISSTPASTHTVSLAKGSAIPAANSAAPMGRPAS